MIKNFKHRGLRLLHEQDNAKGVQPQFVEKIRNILTVLEFARTLPGAVDLPGYRLHPMTGDRRGTWSLTITRNWRITFKIDGRDAVDVDYEDYHER